MTFLALDPGETTGWAFLGPEGFPAIPKPHGASMGQIAGQQPLRRWLRALQEPPSVIIYESFRIRGHYKNHFGQEHETIQNIGIIKSYYYDLIDMGFEVELVKQDPTRKRMGYGWAGLKESGDHSQSHRKDAMAHGVYYVVTKKIRPIIRLND